LSAFLLVPGRRDQIARELGRTADVDERAPLGAEPFANLVAVGPDVLVALARPVLLPRWRRRLGRELAALVDPLLAAAVEDADVLVPVQLQVPVRVRGKPVVLVAVEDDRRVAPDPALAEQALERLLVDDVALDRVLKVSRQWTFTAPGMCPSSYRSVFSSTSATTRPSSFACSSSQSVVTSTGFANPSSRTAFSLRSNLSSARPGPQRHPAYRRVSVQDCRSGRCLRGTGHCSPGCQDAGLVAGADPAARAALLFSQALPQQAQQL